MNVRTVSVLVALISPLAWYPMTARADHGGHHHAHKCRMPGQARIPSSPHLLGKYRAHPHCGHHHRHHNYHTMHPAELGLFGRHLSDGSY